MVTGADTPYKSLADAVKAAKAKPGSLNFASPGNGTVAHLTSELFQKAANAKMQRCKVPNCARSSVTKAPIPPVVHPSSSPR